MTSVINTNKFLIFHKLKVDGQKTTYFWIQLAANASDVYGTHSMWKTGHSTYLYIVVMAGTAKVVSHLHQKYVKFVVIQ